jgi:hypothetical protein
MRTIFLLAFLLVGCDELSAYDDPRDWGESTSTDRGTCTGVPTRCNVRPATQCGGGCVIVSGACQSTNNQRCLSHGTSASCEQDVDCVWLLSHCEMLSGGAACDLHSDRVACTNEDSEDCDWDPECQGYADSCSEAQTEAACLINAGCEWISD